MVIEFDYIEVDPKVTMQADGSLYVQAPKVLLPGIMRLIDEFIIKTDRQNIDKSIEKINSWINRAIQ